MPDDHVHVSSGLPGIDYILRDLWEGDNVVWQVDDIAQYQPFVTPFVDQCLGDGRTLIYFRFARHRELIPAGTAGVTVHRLDPEVGFETFESQILDIIEAAGKGACYVFDCLSDLAVDWYSDLMLGNFFRITCPFLYQLDTVAYFALIRDRHMLRAVEDITRTAQVVLEVRDHRHQTYVQPLKVDQRYSPTMYTLHAHEGDTFIPVTNSAILAEIQSSSPQQWMDFKIYRTGVWIRTFLHAQETLAAVNSGKLTYWEANDCFRRLLRMAVTRDDRAMALAEEYFDLADVVGIIKRMIGTGLIGGKSLGMLLARAIIRRHDPDWAASRLEAHDSFYIGSDVFYSYLVENDCWWSRRRQRDPEHYADELAETRAKMLAGTFPEWRCQQFTDMLNYFGQSPIIVRSSSLLEDNYGNAFSGKYESVFCPNQGSPEERLADFVDAVRRVYASAMGREALDYRAHRGLLAHDEQMALLVQRVSGNIHGTDYFPEAAGVAFSYNPYVWHEDIDPHAGFVRLVTGLGTRAVDRTADDYTRLVALNAPDKRINASAEAMWRHSQRRVDLIDLAGRKHAAKPFDDIARHLPEWLLHLVATRDTEMERRARQYQAKDVFPWCITLDGLLAHTDFVAALRRILKALDDAYRYPVDVEFTVNFVGPDDYRLNVVQCRPFQVRLRAEGRMARYPENVPAADILLTTRGPLIGQSSATVVDRLVYVRPSAYSELSVRDRHRLAQTIGKLTTAVPGVEDPVVMLVGPGRWATSSPSLGVPVSTAALAPVSIICEMAVMHEGLVPDVSLGTHFFNDLVELDMLYLGVIPTRDGHLVQEEHIMALPGALTDVLPQAGEWAAVIKVVDGANLPAGKRLFLNADCLGQRAVCYLSQES